MADTRVPLRTNVVAPQQMSMPPARLDECKAVMVQQETNLCCRCCCCQPNVHYRMSTDVESWQVGTDIAPMWYISENADFCGRCWACAFPGCKQTVWTVHQGDTTSGPPVMTHEKGMTCSHCPAVFCSDGDIIRCPWCCCLPYLETKNAEGQLLGTSRYVCDMCLWVPKFDVFNAEEQHVLRVRPDTCCFGCCVRCRGCQGGQRQGGGRGGKFRVPFLIRKPEEPHDQLGEAAITNLWPGCGRAFCTKQEVLRVNFPENLREQDMHALKATLIGTTLLLNTLLFDHE